MALNLGPGDDAIAQDQTAAVDPQAPAPDGAENAPIPAQEGERGGVADASNSAEQGAAEAPIAGAAEQASTANDAQTAETQTAPDEAQTADVRGEAAAPAIVDASTVDDDAHDLLDGLEDLINRAHHFENAGIERLRAGGLALIERIRAAL
ncbi:hypothetical protein RHSP_31925 [Rhizobium freirei PRF 81]|uniref:Uncharacterized protein n=1 Tax=Rhizobium freirei PRF 81 TaxID=363754 RepID=N6UZD4_9HYPH|nr:hypothetical protein [Rhizobium freirei]ENN86061.1 hypothetical protein RHSP_31925 [Rhizobium freirei PRF 81]